MKPAHIILTLLVFVSLAFRAQSVDEIIDKHITAMGGKEKLKSITSVKMAVKAQAQGFEFPTELMSKKSGSVKTTTTIQNMKMVQCYDANAKAGWFVNPMMGDKKAQKMNDDQVKQIQNQGGRMESDLLEYKEKGHTAEYLGKEDVDGEETYLVKLLKKDGSITYYYIDVLTNLILKEKTKTKLKDKETEGETWYSNYQTVNGITSASTMETFSNNVLVFQINVEKIEYNVVLDDALFKMPEAPTGTQEQNKEK